jgi:hypothetical protein
MIVWPVERRLSDAYRGNLKRFAETAAALELEGDRRVWHLEATSWVDEFPVRLILRSREGNEVCFTLDEPGVWTLTVGDSIPVKPHPYDPLTPLGRPW